jgi:Phage P22-like portal protein
MTETHKEILKRFDNDYAADRANREDGIEDLNFVGGSQWDDHVRIQREDAGRPVITINDTGQFIRQISGDLRQAMPSIEPVPVDDNQDPVMADIFAGIIRQDEYQNSATSAYVWAAEQAIACGIGHWQYGTKYSDDDTFNQDITIARIMDPFAVTWDSSSSKLNRSDAKCCFVTEWISKEQYKRDFKTDSTPTDFSVPVTWTNSLLNWQREDRVRIASYWYKVPRKKRIGLLASGEVIDLERIPRDLVQFLDVKRERTVETFDIKHQKLSGDAILSEESWVGRHIPIVPVIGNEVCIEGRVMRYGVVRWMKDPARLYNYFRSAAAEVIAKQPKSPYLVPFHSIAGLERFWDKANGDLPYLPYIVDEKMPNAGPTRLPPPQPSTAMYQETSIATEDKHAATGIYPSSLGQRSNETSGRAIEARQQAGNTGTFVYFDNFHQAMQWGGTIHIDLISKLYDGERVVRILGRDASEQTVTINKTVGNLGDPFIINDISQGKFDIRVKTAPSFVSAREQAKEALTQLVASQPELMAVIGDLYFESMDFPGAKKIAARLKKTMDPKLLGDDPDAAQPEPQDPVIEALKRLQVAQIQKNVEKTAAEVGKTKAQTVEIIANVHGKAIDHHTKIDDSAFSHVKHLDSITPQADGLPTQLPVPQEEVPVGQ